jgi:cell pole-organizing protein PopZ
LTDADIDEPEPVELAEPEPEPEPEPVVEEPPVMPAAAPLDNSLLSDNAAAQATGHLAGLSDALANTRGVPLGNPNKTLEDVAKELLRPMLKEWLDENLPSLVERLVDKEIDKLVGRAEED